MPRRSASGTRRCWANWRSSTISPQDPATQVIAFYIEGFGANEGREFVLKAGKCGKPVIVLKSGKSPGGSAAVSSHTASLAGDYASFSAALSQYGIVEAANELELVSFCESLSAYAKPIAGQGRNRHGQRRARRDGRRCLHRPRDRRSRSCRKRSGRRSARASARASGRSPRSPIPIDLTGSGIDDDFVATAETLFAMEEIDCVLALLLPYVPGITVRSRRQAQQRRPAVRQAADRLCAPRGEVRHADRGIRTQRRPRISLHRGGRAHG